MFITKRDEKETNCFTYEVKMVIQVIAPDLETANSQLDANGGYISFREVNLLDSVNVHTGADDEDSTKGPSETV